MMGQTTPKTRETTTMRRLENYVRRYGPEVGPKLYHALQSQAAHASVSARLRRKIDVLSGRAPAPAPAKVETVESLPLFPAADGEAETAIPPLAVGA
jgi:hypothetical protein